MDQICKRINDSNQIIYSYVQMRKMIVNLGSEKGQKKSDKSSPQLKRLHNSLLTSIVSTPVKDLSNVEGKYDMMKVCTYLVKSSSKLLLCSIHAIYNRVYYSQQLRLMLKSYIRGTN